MEEVLFTSGVYRLAFALLALLGLFLLLRLFDKLSGHSFNTAYSRINDNAQALAVYYGLRFMGACLLLGQLLS